MQLYAPPIHSSSNTSLTPPFLARIRPIKPLKGPVSPYEKGSNILRGFLYARQKWPNSPFRTVSPQAMEAIYESNRVDGLPRVLFVVSKEVETPLRGKMHGTLRAMFRRRAKVAFKFAIEGLRREDKGALIPSAVRLT